jgi:hypothetical protein
MVVQGLGACSATTNCSASTIPWKRLWRSPKHSLINSYEP